MAAVLTAAGLLAAGCTADPAPSGPPAASTPPTNPWLTESEYPITHFNSAATDASTVTGPEVSKELAHSDVQYVGTTYSSNPTVKYIGDDRIVLAPSMYGIHKILATGDRFEEIDFLPYPGTQPPDPALVKGLMDATDAAIAAGDDAALVGLAGQAEAAGISYPKIPNGAYSMIDKDGYHYSVIEGGRVLRTTDDSLAEGPLRYDKVVDLHAAALPEGTPPEVAAAVRQPGVQFVGMGMTYDGHVVVGSSSALYVMNRDLDIVALMPFSNELLENSFAIDEAGIYAVTSRRMLKVAWTGEKLSIAEQDGGWEADYTRSDPAIAQAAGSLTRSGGSGTTPTLMGFGPGEDKLVVISDANADGPSLVAFWRDEIPADTDAGETGSQSSRIAGEVKVDRTDVTLELSPPSSARMSWRRPQRIQTLLRTYGPTSSHQVRRGRRRGGCRNSTGTAQTTPSKRCGRTLKSTTAISLFPRFPRMEKCCTPPVSATAHTNTSE